MRLTMRRGILSVIPAGSPMVGTPINLFLRLIRLGLTKIPIRLLLSVGLLYGYGLTYLQTIMANWVFNTH